MNSKDKGDYSGGSGASSTASELITRSSSINCPAENDVMKRAAAKKLIERYYHQLTDGCGNPKCTNEFCASSGKVKDVSPNQAAVQALELFTRKVRLCEAQPSKVARTQISEEKKREAKEVEDPPSPTTVPYAKEPLSPAARPEALRKPPVVASADEASSGKAAADAVDTSDNYLNEERLNKVLETCKQNESYKLLKHTLGQVFSSTEAVMRSFIKQNPDSPLEAVLDRASLELHSWKKEDFRALEGDLDKDEDSLEIEENRRSAESMEIGNPPKRVPPDDIAVDVPSLRRAFTALFEIQRDEFESALIHALIGLSQNAALDQRIGDGYEKNPDFLNIFFIVFEIPGLGSSEFTELVLPEVCKAAARLPLEAQARLARVWARHSRSRLKHILDALQQLVTLKVIYGAHLRNNCLNDDENITLPTKLMKVLYYSSILAGEFDASDSSTEESETETMPEDAASDSLLGAVGLDAKEQRVRYEDELATHLGVSVLECRTPAVPFSDFYNEPLSDTIEMDKDFAYFKTENDSQKFSFMNYSFVLTPATKCLGLYYDNRIRMYSERRFNLWQSILQGQPTNPYLKLKVRRDHIIDDALVELEIFAMGNPMDLKKQLVVEFEGEQGIDEGGVSKEFFQLIVEEIFNPDYGMFTFNEETQTVWFNPTSFENDGQFTLIGIVLGLAIYNNVILDVHFPMVVYRKLMGKKGTFFDLRDWNPTMYTSLKELLEYEEDDMEEVFLQTFRVCYQDVFGTALYHDLKPEGDQILVSQENKREFVNSYADFLLNGSVKKQFRAFHRGFQMVTDESPLHLLFRPEEVEQLVCGSKDFNFSELEEATEYDGGYAPETPVIRNFWAIVHEMPLESKQKLLQFATGSDRVPVGGLSKLKLIISRHGPDCDRLPTAHTCFNVLLLPEYESKEKLRDRLTKAINYSKGFGML